MTDLTFQPFQEPKPTPIPDRWAKDIEHDRKAQSDAQAAMLATFTEAARINPEKRAEAVRVAGELGLNWEDVAAQPEVFRAVQSRRLLADQRFAETNPILARKMGSLEFASIAHDLANPLSLGEKLTKNWDAGRLTVERGEIYSRMMKDAATPDDITRLGVVQATLDSLPAQDGFLTGSARILGQMYSTMPTVLAAGAATGGAFAGVTLAAGTAIPLPEEIATVPLSFGFGMKVGAAGAMALSAYRVEAGNAFGDMLSRGYDREAAKRSAIGVGLFNAALEVTGAKLATAPFRQVIKDRLAKDIAKAAVLPATKSAAMQFALRYAKGVGGEVGTETVQELSTMIGEWAASGGKPSDIGDGKAWSRLVETAAATAQGMALLGLPGPALQLYSDRQRIAASERQQEFVAGLSTSVDTLRDRSPDEARAFVADTVAGTGAENGYVNGARFADVLQQADKASVAAGKLERSTLDQLREALPEVADQIEQAAATGLDVQIPLADFVAKVPKALRDALTPFLRLGPSLEESAELQTQAKESERVATEQAKAFEVNEQEAREIEDRIRTALQGAGRPTQFARADAEFYRAMVETQSKLRGMTPKAWDEKYGLREIATEGDAQLQQGAKIDTPEFRNWFGDSKVVDADGKPLVVYHGSPDARFVTGGDATFRNRWTGSAEDGAHWFASSRKTAATYADDRRAFDYQNAEPGLVDAYLVARNPLIVDAGGSNWRDAQKRGRTADIIADAKAAGHDSIIIRAVKDDYNNDAKTRPTDTYVVFSSTQIKSATGNRGTFDPADPNILRQGGRGGYNPPTRTLILTKEQDASTFVHELAHHYLSVLSQMAEQDVSGPAATDFGLLLNWFGVESLEAWKALGPAGQEKFQERFAYSFEGYMFDGKAPSLELQGLFDRMAAWVRAAYRFIRDNINATYREAFGEDLPALTPEVRQVMDRMVASEDAIAYAQAVRGGAPAMLSREQFGGTDEDFASYRANFEEFDAKVIADVQTAGMRDMKWLSGAKSRLLKELQAQADAQRDVVRDEVVAALRAEPVRQAIRWIKTGELLDDNGNVIAKEEGEHKLDRESVRAMLGLTDAQIDAGDAVMFDAPKPKKPKRGKSMVTRIRELGGISRESWDTTYPGEQRGEFRIKGVVAGAKSRRGMSWEAMAQQLRAEGYAPSTAEDGDQSWFVDALQDSANGTPVYSNQEEVAQQMPEQVDNRAPETDEERAQREQMEAEDAAERAAIATPVQVRFPERAMKQLRGLVKIGGIDPDIAAESFALGTGADMVRAILEAPDMQAEVNRRTDERMLAEFGEMSDPRKMEATVSKALHNEARARFVATELRALAKSIQPVRVWVAQAKEAARAVLLKRTVASIRVGEFEMAEARARRQGDRALRAGDTKAAIDARRNELVQHELVRMARDAKEDVDKTTRRWKKLDKADADIGKTRNIDIVAAARAIVGRMGLGRWQGDPLKALQATAEYRPELFAELAEDVRAAAEIAKGDYRSMTLENFRNVAAIVDTLWTRAEQVQSVLVDGKRVERATFLADLDARLETIGVPEELPGEKAPTTWRERMGFRASSIRALLTRVEHWARKMDGGKTGPFTRLFRMVRSPLDSYREQRNQVVKEYRDLVASHDLTGSDYYSKTLDQTFTRATLIGALLHAGNLSNLRKLLLGYGWGRMVDGPGGAQILDRSRWDQFIEDAIADRRLTAADFEFAQKVWDLHEKLKPAAQEAHLRMFGFRFEEIESAPVTNSLGSWRGGYVPASADRDTVQQARRVESFEELKADFRQMMPGVARGFTKSRTEAVRRLSLDLRLTVGHLDNVVRFIHVAPAVQDALSLVNSRDFSTKLGRIDRDAVEGLLLPFLTRASTQRVEMSGISRTADEFWRFLRTAAGASAMFAKLVSGLQQLTGLSNASAIVPVRHLRGGLLTLMKERGAMHRRIAGMSKFMADRFDNQSGGMQAEVDAMVVQGGWWSKARGWTARNTYFMQRAFQNQVDAVTWQGAYNNALELSGAEATDADAHRAAVAEADAAVRQTQGSGNAEDVAAYEMSTPFIRIWYQFGGYINNVLNQIQAEQSAKDKAGVIVRALLIPALGTALIAKTLRKDWDDEDEDGYLDEVVGATLAESAKGVLGMIPAFGPALSGIAFPRQESSDRLSIPPAMSMLEKLVGAVKDLPAVFDGERELKGSEVRDIWTLIAVATLPIFAPIGSAAGYQRDVDLGRKTPSGAADYVRGIVTGR